MRRSTGIVLLAMAVGLAVLLTLGTWQVKRLQWKEALIERVNSRLELPPVEPVIALRAQDGVSPEYSPVTVSGTITDFRAAYEFTTFKGRSGWNVFVPFRLAPADVNGSPNAIMINLGFVPFEAKDHERPLNELPALMQSVRLQELSRSPVTLDGLLRLPLANKPGLFVNDNDPASRTYFWRDLGAMQATAASQELSFHAWYLDVGIPGRGESQDEFPIPGTTLVTFSNNHLQYAITWYGLALALLGVGSYFLYARRKSEIE